MQANSSASVAALPRSSMARSDCAGRGLKRTPLGRGHVTAWWLTVARPPQICAVRRPFRSSCGMGATQPVDAILRRPLSLTRASFGEQSGVSCGPTPGTAASSTALGLPARERSAHYFADLLLESPRSNA